MALAPKRGQSGAGLLKTRTIGARNWPDQESGDPGAVQSVWYHLAGADREHARMHMTIAMPGATAQSTGLPDKRKENGVWIMNAGTSTAHLMTPGE